ncbi:MAG: sugar phosphate isomerase/epimerase [Planctomycetales bacterium]|nr:sugar phosphate isomerase/epimerase [Planctomycetales bacterium]
MLVAASTECYPGESLQTAVDRLVDLEYTNIEIAIGDNAQITPAEVMGDFDETVNRCLSTRRLNVVAYAVDLPIDGQEYYDQFHAICRLAKATKVVTLIVPSAELGTPFNEEVERLRKLVSIADLEGARVAMRSQVGCLTEDPDTITVLCDNAKGLGLCFDPSHYICRPERPRNVDKLMKYVYHVHLRDTSKDELQVRIGKGEVDYGRLVGLLEKVKYSRALSVHLQPMPDVDHMAEMRKMRLLLESLL